MIAEQYRSLSNTELYEIAKRYIPGGVNSPVRCFYGVGGEPTFMQRGEGARLYDINHKPYIDYVLSWGPLILGHAHPDVVANVIGAVNNGLGYGTATAVEVEIAEKICEYMPNIEMVRMVNSGTEATMSAIRLARGYTHRDKIIKFEGCYHGHSDSLLVKAGSGALTLGHPSSPGVPQDLVQHTLTATFNDLDSVTQCFEQFPDQIACIILEPIAANMNFVLPEPGFLQGLRALCDQYNTVLIMDEVMTGFRITRGGAQQYFDIKPDLTTLGKVIGGGLPVGAYGGKREIMQHISPVGAVYQAGTLSGNPVAMAAGLATLNGLAEPDVYSKLEKLTIKFMAGLATAAKAHNIPLHTSSLHSMFGFFFTDEEKITNYQQVVACNVEQFKTFFHGMLERGIYLAPSAFESGFTSTAHTEADIEATLNAAEDTFKQMSS